VWDLGEFCGKWSLACCLKDCAIYFCGTCLDKVQGYEAKRRIFDAQTAWINAAGIVFDPCLLGYQYNCGLTSKTNIRLTVVAFQIIIDYNVDEYMLSL